jgi:hypothetical protein
MRFKLWNPKNKNVQKKDGKDLILDTPTKGEARHQFKALFGERPQSCKGTRKRLPVGFRVAGAS